MFVLLAAAYSRAEAEAEADPQRLAQYKYPYNTRYSSLYNGYNAYSNAYNRLNPYYNRGAYYNGKNTFSRKNTAIWNRINMNANLLDNDHCFSGLYGNLNMYANNPYAYSGYPYGHLGAYGLRQGYYPYTQTAGTIAL